MSVNLKKCVIKWGKCLAGVIYFLFDRLFKANFFLAPWKTDSIHIFGLWYAVLWNGFSFYTRAPGVPRGLREPLASWLLAFDVCLFEVVQKKNLCPWSVHHHHLQRPLVYNDDFAQNIMKG
jgi:hypothetical protein